MAALRYDIQLRTNAFAHRVVINGDPSVPDISVLRTDIAESCYAEARNFDELDFRDINPYAQGGPRAHLDPLTCLPKPGKHPFAKNNAMPIAPQNPPFQHLTYGQHPTYSQPQPMHYPQTHFQHYQPQQQQSPHYQLAPTTPNNAGQKHNEPRGQRSGGYKGKNFIPNYQDNRRSGAPPQGQANNQMVLSSQSAPTQRNEHIIPICTRESNRRTVMREVAIETNRERQEEAGDEPPEELVSPTSWPTKIRCEMNIPEWEMALSKAGLLPEFQDVLDGFRNGFNQGIPQHRIGDLPHYTPANHASALQAKEKIEKSLRSEISAGRMFGPFEKEQDTRFGGHF
ncbi:hypothetical protein PGTUg99_023517 [Puccinia graminis f. sp. tritici]|uniref:Uncharacterized protein n=1 Tax=Puccinia graminis f. sp. tritici TaxID=56615 RepID=A0A5B0NJ54_PUCGR|nr:hypothetical protein PGTUg99_023517 [Puccinia graminis f. sp. tritici]